MHNQITIELAQSFLEKVVEILYSGVTNSKNAGLGRVAQPFKGW